MASEEPRHAKSLSLTPAAVPGAEALTVGTDAWVQVVNDVARAQEGIEPEGFGICGEDG